MDANAISAWLAATGETAAAVAKNVDWGSFPDWLGLSSVAAALVIAWLESERAKKAEEGRRAEQAAIVDALVEAVLTTVQPALSAGVGYSAAAEVVVPGPWQRNQFNDELIPHSLLDAARDLFAASEEPRDGLEYILDTERTDVSIRLSARKILRLMQKGSLPKVGRSKEEAVANAKKWLDDMRREVSRIERRHSVNR